MRFFIVTLGLPLFAVLAASLIFIGRHMLVDVSVLECYDPGKPTVLLDDTGAVWATFALDIREPIDIKLVPRYLIDACIAAEDWQFFTHPGISFKGIIRSLLVNLRHGRAVQGASTITQQLVRLIYFGHKKTLTRKIKEQIIALLLEMRFTKEQILQAYLNHIYFGCGIYGVQAAARRFWAKSIQEITLDEAATLLAVVRSPGTYCPLLHPEATLRRRNLILRNMLKLGLISQEACDAALAKPMVIVEQQDYKVGLYAKEAIRSRLERLVGSHELYTGGYVVQTTLNKSLQEKAEQAFSVHMESMRRTIDPSVQGALITMHGTTGEIKALIGGYDFNESRFNRALQARRQLGSVFKPIVYAAALEAGKEMDEVLVDEPFSMVDERGVTWQPQNFDRTFIGPMTRAYALSHSNNIVTIKTLLEIGAPSVVAMARRCGIKEHLHPWPSLALGTVDTTLDTALGMFNLFVHDGIYVKPHMISWVKDAWGQKIYAHKPQSHVSVSSAVAGKILKVLTLGLERVRATMPDTWIDSESASKTGTTNDFRTCWFMGATPELTTGIYVGCDDNHTMGNDRYPLHTAFPIWLGLHRQLTTQHKTFHYDPTLQAICIDDRTGKRVKKEHPRAIGIFV
jgi:penicillin-binding protein 1A